MNIKELENQVNAAKHKDTRWYVENVLTKHADKLTLVQAEHLLDYFESIPNKRIKKMSLKDALRLADEWTERLKKKGQDIAETEQDVKVFMQFNDGVRFVQLVSKASFLREGNLMSHCVGSYADKTNVKIYSLRDVKNQPHCTIEVDSGVNQIKGKGNGSVHPKYIKYVLKFLKKIDKVPREPEMAHLGYITWSDETWKLIQTETRGVKELTFNGTRYFYKYSKLVRIL